MSLAGRLVAFTLFLPFLNVAFGEFSTSYPSVANGSDGFTKLPGSFV